MTPDLDTPLWLVLLVAGLSWAGLVVQQWRRLVRRRRAARAALARVLPQRREDTGPDDGELEQQPQRNQHDPDSDTEDKRKLKVLKDGHAPSVSTWPPRWHSPELVTGVHRG